MFLAISVTAPALAAFSATVALVLAIAWFSLLIRGRLPPGSHGRDQSTEVRATLFRERLRYVTSGPVAEFVVLMATIAFVVVVFWLLLNRGG